MIATHKKSIVDRLQFGFSRRLPMQRQTESAECGLACLSMIASFYGHRTDVPTLRKRFPISQNGATLQQIIQIASSLQLAPRPLRAELEELKDLQTPCVLHWKMDHFVVLREVTRSGIVVHDPARGERTYRFDEVSKYFTGVALELRPMAAFTPKVERQTIRLSQLLGKVVGLKRSLAQILLLAIVMEGFVLISPFFNQLIVDQAITTSDVHLLITLAVGFGLVKLTSAAIDLIRSWALVVMSATMNVQWLANLFSHLLKLPVSYFEKRHVGDVVSRFNSIHTVQSTLTNGFIGSVLDGLLAIGTGVMMFIYSPMLAGITLLALVLYLLLRGALYASLMAATESEVVADARQQTMFLETVRGIQAVRLFNKEVERGALWMNSIVEKKNANLRTQRLTLSFQGGNSVLFGIENVAIMCLGAKLAMDNVFSVGMLFAFISYKDQFSARIRGLIDKYFEFKMLRFQIERMADIALERPEQSHEAAISSVDHLEASFQVSNLMFSYAMGEKPVLFNVNFEVKPGESVAVVGPSGCGKSTLLKLLLGIHNPKMGEIKVGGVPIKMISPVEYKKMIGVVMQDDMLFAGSIADNISFFSPDADLSWVEECARMAAIHDEIKAMPMGYYSLIGDVGNTLSGGQRQRVLLARALYKRPRILLMDEATSHLDLATEQAVNSVIKTLAITRLIIAHRPETIASADRVIQLRPPIPSVKAPGKPAAQEASATVTEGAI
jgi:ATP-binding cassette subfamily B protein RaxB